MIKQVVIIESPPPGESTFADLLIGQLFRLPNQTDTNLRQKVGMFSYLNFRLDGPTNVQDVREDTAEIDRGSVVIKYDGKLEAWPA